MKEKDNYAFNPTIDHAIYDENDGFIVKKGLFEGCPVTGAIESDQFTNGVFRIGRSMNVFYIEQKERSGSNIYADGEGVFINKENASWRCNTYLRKANDGSVMRVFSDAVFVIPDIPKMIKYLSSINFKTHTIIAGNINHTYITGLDTVNKAQFKVNGLGATYEESFARAYLNLIKYMKANNPEVVNGLINDINQDD